MTDKQKELLSSMLYKITTIKHFMLKGKIDPAMIIIDFHQGEGKEKAKTIKLLGMNCIVPSSFDWNDYKDRLQFKPL